jgi:type IV secretory pathway protease TraF
VDYGIAGTVIPAGHVYAGSLHPDSFDSRYLGLIPAAQILGELHPVLVFKN